MDGLVDSWSSVAGYVGAAIIAVAYFLNQAGRLRSDRWPFPAVNLLGSQLILASLLVHVNLPSVVIEVFWSTISIYGLVRVRRRAGLDEDVS